MTINDKTWNGATTRNSTATRNSAIWTNRTSPVKGVLRRHAALLVFLALLGWIITIVVLISLNPTPGGGSPV